MKRIGILGIFLLAFFYTSSCAELFPTSHYFDDKLAVELANAALKGDGEGISRAIEKGADASYAGLDDLTPLHWLIVARKNTEKNKAGFRMLLENGANPHRIEARLGLSVLQMAAQYEDSDYLRILMESGVDPNHVYSTQPSDPTVLFNAASAGRYENMEILLNYGADTEIKAELGWTVLLRTPADWRAAYVLLMHRADYTVEYPVVGGTIASRLEIVRYWPPKDGVDWRARVVDFLRERGVEVNPWMPPDEER